MDLVVKFVILGSAPRPSRRTREFLDALSKIDPRLFPGIPRNCFKSRGALWRAHTGGRESQGDYNAFLAKNPRKMRTRVGVTPRRFRIPRGKFSGSGRRRRNYKSSVFGPIFWAVLHAESLASPSPQWKGVIDNLGHVLPCVKCRTNFAKHGEMSSGWGDPFRYFVQLHNAVNRDLGKRPWSVGRARGYWSRRAHYYYLTY